MRKAIVAPFLLVLILCLTLARGWAGGRTYYDADGNVISEDAYREMRERRQKCLQTTSDHFGFTQCMEGAATRPSGPLAVEPPQEQPPARGTPEPEMTGTPPPETKPDRPPPGPAEPEPPVDTPPVSAAEPGPVAAPQPDVPPAPAPPETPKTAAPTKMDHPVIPGQEEQPVRVIEREIAVPGGGVLKVKEYQYEQRP